MFMFDDFLSGLFKHDFVLMVCRYFIIFYWHEDTCSVIFRGILCWTSMNIPLQQVSRNWGIPIFGFRNPVLGKSFQGWPINCPQIRDTEHAKSSPSSTNLSDLKRNMGKNEGMAQSQLPISWNGVPIRLSSPQVEGGVEWDRIATRSASIDDRDAIKLIDISTVPAKSCFAASPGRTILFAGGS